jgi:hypothetical protein
VTLPCDYTFDDYGFFRMVQMRVFNIKVRKGREQTCQQVTHRLVTVADGTKWCKLITGAVKSRDNSGNIMSFLGGNVFSHNCSSAL